jgi:hypothetical protein
MVFDPPNKFYSKKCLVPWKNFLAKSAWSSQMNFLSKKVLGPVKEFYPKNITNPKNPIQKSAWFPK